MAKLEETSGRCWLTVTGATVLVREHGTDRVSLLTILPPPFPPDVDPNPLSLSFEATKGTGVAYVKKHFPAVPIEMIDLRDGTKTKL